MRVCILGVGRSGTTALYSLLQEILIDRIGKNNIDFVYEPFLWDMQAFNGRYNDVVARFDSMNSLSVEAMYHHQNLPMFIENPAAFKENPYLDKIFHKTSETTLIKFIRANGRFRLLSEICPPGKFIFIIRNPLDVINSVVVRFSLLGSDFHKDDWDRFSREVNSLYGQETIVGEKIKSQVEKEVLYWYYMNRFALESFEQTGNKPLIIYYEDYVSRREFWVDRICDFIDVQRKDIYYQHSQKIAGSRTLKNNLSKTEFDMLAGYMDKYKALLTVAGITYPDDLDKITAKYKTTAAETNRKGLIVGKTPNAMNVYIQKLEGIMMKKEDDLVGFNKKAILLEKELGKREDEILSSGKKIDELDGTLTIREKEIADSRERISRLETELEKREAEISNSGKRIDELGETLAIREKEIAGSRERINRLEVELTGKNEEIALLEKRKSELEQRKIGFGWLTRLKKDSPGERIDLKFGVSQIGFYENSVLSVKGWCFAAKKIDRIEFFIENQCIGETPVNILRSDVLKKYKECKNERCGFQFEKTLTLESKTKLVLKFYAKAALVGAESIEWDLEKIRRQGKAVQEEVLKNFPNETNNRRLLALKNIHKGKRAFLIGNGPSLRIEDLEKLKNEITFASNKIFLAFDQTDWRPTYYTMADHIVAENNKETINSLKLQKIFAHSVGDYFKEQKDVIFTNPPTTEGDESWDLVKGVRAGYSVLNFDLKLAYWMGIREVYVIGVDFYFEDKSIRTGRFEKGNEVIISVGEHNHFHPDYRKPGETWTIPRLDKQREEFIRARQMYEAAGGKVYNASRQTKLDAWERVDFDQAAAQGREGTATLEIIRKDAEKDNRSSVLIYCADITGHRHLHSAYFIRFFLNRGYVVYFCYAGLISGYLPGGRFGYKQSESPYLDVFRGNPRVHFIDICAELNAAKNELHFIVMLQSKLEPAVSLFIDGDILKWTFLKQLLPWQKRLHGSDFSIICLSEFLYLPVGKLQALKELWLVLYHHFSDPHIFVHRVKFVEKFPLLNKLFFHCLCRFNLLTAVFCPDARLVEKFRRPQVLFLPELVTNNLEVKPTGQESSFYARIKSQYSNFLEKHNGKQVLLMFGDLESRKGYDLLLQLAVQNPDCVCVRFGRTKPGYYAIWETILSKEKLLLEGRLFEVDIYIESQELIDFIFSTVRFMVLPYRKYYRTSGVLIDVLRKGLPVLTPDKGVMAYIVKHYRVGRVFHDGNLAELQKTFTEFKENYHSYVKNIEAFNSAYSEKKIEEILAVMLEKSNGRN
ncbi:MAG: DUF115 domain-containing protein [Candidatus Aminicenantes bacterium]|nr:DUF115 domain-containing protein [Candidatus Aminicenantes bacterium]